MVGGVLERDPARNSHRCITGALPNGDRAGIYAGETQQLARNDPVLLATTAAVKADELLARPQVAPGRKALQQAVPRSADCWCRLGEG